MPSHTKGPWHRNIKPATKYGTIFAGRNTHVCYLNIKGLSDATIEANCDLIVAAPDLLAACKAALHDKVEAYKNTFDSRMYNDYTIRMLREAIAAAEKSYVTNEAES